MVFDDDGYEDRERKRKARYSRESVAEVSDVGSFPQVVDVARRQRCANSLYEFLIAYFPETTGLFPFSEDHKRVIARLEQCILYGGRFLNAVYRGFAKTTITENAAIWAALYGHRRFVPVISANEPAAARIISSIKRELETNDLLYEDFPEVCHAIRSLEGKPQRCNSQTCGEERTYIEWTANKIVLPFVKVSDNWPLPPATERKVPSLASGTILCAYGLTAAARGIKHKTPDGKNLRPDFCIIDDPQTDESAKSPKQVQDRLTIIRKSILKLGGHMSQMACVVNATVIEVDDLVERLARLPGWQSERIKMVRQFADKHDEWLGEYARIRTTFDSDKIDDQERAHQDATEYYRSHRAAMDAGCLVSWEHCYDHDCELSAIQHAYNLLIDDGADVFASECQQQPQDAETDMPVVTAAGIQRNQIALPVGVIPNECHTLTGYIDVQQDVLFWMLVAWGENFRGHIVSYGAWPDQRRAYFSLRDLPKTLRAQHGVSSIDEGIFAGLTHLIPWLGEGLKREDGVQIKPSVLFVDSGYKQSVVHQACRGTIAIPSKGAPIGAKNKPIAEYNADRGDKRGEHCLYTLPPKVRTIRHMLIDTNYWKDFATESLCKAPGAEGVTTLFKDSGGHRMLIDHFRAEYPVRVSANGRTVTEWSMKPGSPDNHWLDCYVGCCVGASHAGIKRRIGSQQEKPRAMKPRKKVSYL